LIQKKYQILINFSS